MQNTQHWGEARVHALRDITPTVREITLKPANGALPHQPGGHLQMQVLVGAGVSARPQTRSYSLIGQPDGNFYRIAVKRLEDGRGGSKAMWQLAVGDRLQISEPQNHFPLDLAAPAYLLVAGGIGVTPLVGMAQLLAQRAARVRMLFGARSETELAYLEALKTALKGDLKTAIAELDERIDFETEIAQLHPQAQMYVCGPVPMLDAARKAWAAAGRPSANLRYETFGSSGRFAPQAFKVKIPRHQLDITVPADSGLLDELEMAGVQAMYDCRRGECGLCAMDVLCVDGEIDHRDVFLSDAEKASNQRICVCVSRVVGEITLDSAYRAD
jgi:ferredoxin-NADP reductase